MPRAYNYTVEDVNKAVNDILNGKFTYQAAAVEYNVPKTVLFNRIKGRKHDIVKLGAGRPTLVQCLTARAQMVYSCDKEELKDLLQEYIQVAGKDTRFADGKPGENWYQDFMHRNPKISLKKPTTLNTAPSTSSARIYGEKQVEMSLLKAGPSKTSSGDGQDCVNLSSDEDDNFSTSTISDGETTATKLDEETEDNEGTASVPVLHKKEQEKYSLSCYTSPGSKRLMWKISFPTLDGKSEKCCAYDDLNSVEQLLQEHLQELINEENLTSKVIKQGAIKNGRFKCIACHLLLPSEVAFMEHISFCPAACVKCKCLFNSKENLELHYQWCFKPWEKKNAVSAEHDEATSAGVSTKRRGSAEIVLPGEEESQPVSEKRLVYDDCTKYVVKQRSASKIVISHSENQNECNCIMCS